MNKTNFCLKLQSTGCSTSSVPRKEHNTAAVMEQAALQGHQFTQGHSASQDLDSPSLTWALQQQSKFCSVKGKQNICD